MEVSSVKNNINFTSRAPQVRDAEKFCRLVSEEFPVMSSTRYAEFTNAEKTQRIKECIERLHEKDYKEIRIPFDQARSQKGHKEAILTLIKKIKEHKIANCADFAKLCSVICHMNGVEVIQPELYLVTKSGAITGEIVDHAVLMIKSTKMPFLEKLKNLKDTLIIDPWLGFADFAPNVERKFKGEYSKFFKIRDEYDIALTPYAPQGIKFDKKTISALRKEYPQFILKKGKSLAGEKHDK